MKLLLFALGICFMLSNCVWAQDAEVDPPQVYRYADKISQMLIAIAEEMGGNVSHGDIISVSAVSPREVYFQAASLYGKTSRLMFEFTSEEGERIIELKPDAKPADAMALLLGAERHLLAVTKRLKMPEKFELQALDPNKQPRDVFALIVSLNRKTNNLLDFKFSPAESHQKITESIAFASAILATYPNAEVIFYPQKFIRKKTATDVYQRIVSMYERMIPIMDAMNKSCLVLGEEEKKREDVVPSDVYDLAVLVTSQLRYLHSLMPNAPIAKESYYPGKVIPSDVYQRLSILEQQINELLRVNSITIASY
jgi:hypothetical protein